MKRIAVLTSGGDAPGMNACLRAVVRFGIFKELEVIGINRGYEGLIAGEAICLNRGSVSNIVQLGGTILKTARSREFMTKRGQERAAKTLNDNEIEGLIVIGGDGSFRGLYELGKIWEGSTIGIPGTIDNDIYGTDYTIGFDSAVNTALEAIDKIRDTAQAHERIFLVEVMGREAGFLALEVGVGGGAEEILIPETKTDLKKIYQRLMDGRKKGKRSSIIVVAEGDEAGSALEIGKKLEALDGLEARVTVLGHVQRGGSPTALDRILASKLGVYAVEALLAGKTGVMVGEVNQKLLTTPLPETWEKKKKIDSYLQRIYKILSS